MPYRLTRQQADIVYELLKQQCNAKECYKPLFVQSVIKQTRFGMEFRFQGDLGFGGKFHSNSNGWYVSCYPEDETEELKLKIGLVNRVLEKFKDKTE